MYVLMKEKNNSIWMCYKISNDMFKWRSPLNIKWNNPFGYPNHTWTLAWFHPICYYIHIITHILTPFVMFMIHEWHSSKHLAHAIWTCIQHFISFWYTILMYDLTLNSSIIYFIIMQWTSWSFLAIMFN
jgi:hypothetical protein